MTQIQVLRTQNADLDVPLPSYETAQAAGMDLRANLPLEQRVEGITLAPNGRALVPTGLAIALPHGIEAQIRPRSGLALHHGITLLNSPGTIDADYRGELGVILLNTSVEPFTVRHGDRIAQMVLAPVVQADWHPVADLPLSPRGDGGFGSTGR